MHTTAAFFFCATFVAFGVSQQHANHEKPKCGAHSNEASGNIIPEISSSVINTLVSLTNPTTTIVFTTIVPTTITFDHTSTLVSSVLLTLTSVTAVTTASSALSLATENPVSGTGTTSTSTSLSVANTFTSGTTSALATVLPTFIIGVLPQGSSPAANNAVARRDDLTEQDCQQEHPDGFLGSGVSAGDGSCGLAEKYIPVNGELVSSEGLPVSVDPGVPFIDLTNSTIGSITTTFSTQDNILVWSNPQFFGGAARFCRSLNRTIYALFTDIDRPENCSDIELIAYNSSRCVGGTFSANDAACSSVSNISETVSSFIVVPTQTLAPTDTRGSLDSSSNVLISTSRGSNTSTPETDTTSSRHTTSPEPSNSVAETSGSSQQHSTVNDTQSTSSESLATSSDSTLPPSRTVSDSVSTITSVPTNGSSLEVETTTDSSTGAASTVDSESTTESLTASTTESTPLQDGGAGTTTTTSTTALHPLQTFQLFASGSGTVADGWQLQTDSLVSGTSDLRFRSSLSPVTYGLDPTTGGLIVALNQNGDDSFQSLCCVTGRGALLSEDPTSCSHPVCEVGERLRCDAVTDDGILNCYVGSAANRTAGRHISQIQLQSDGSYLFRLGSFLSPDSLPVTLVTQYTTQVSTTISPIPTI